MSDSSIEPQIPIPRQTALGRWMRRNPVTLKELRGRMRGTRAAVVLTGYVLVMSGFVVLLYLIYSASASLTLSTTGGVIGKVIFAGVVAVELFMVSFIAPAFTTAAVSGERERRTFDLLRTTLLPARRIVFGKLVSALAYIVLLLFVAVPLQSLAFLMGGVTIEEVLLSVELLLVTAIAYGTVGIFFSAWTKRTLSASILTYSFALLMTLALPLGLLALLPVTAFGFGGFYNQPVLEGLLTYTFGLLASINPITAGVLTEIVLLQNGTAFYFTQTLSNGAMLPLVSPWIVYTVVYLVGSVVLLSLSVRFVRRTEV
jgi:ABC-2 type transport system permease protein